ncbi:MAG: class I SAM-dependent methyltransferase [bacterium]|nr:class I SAM-dependent methyltransferase [bacterium]
MNDPRDLAANLLRLMADDDRPARECERLATLMALFATLPPPPDPLGLWPDFVDLQVRFRGAIAAGRPDPLEESFLELYCHVHGYEAPYTPDERARMDEVGGYWCHAGGLSPVLKAGEHLGPTTVSADYGAGNGLQGLLLMKLYPHARTVQIELSSRMVEAGRILQTWLGIPDNRVEWIVGDVLDHPPHGLDFIYLYRPVKPKGEGRLFYERFAAALAAAPGQVVIFSIADCLRDFLGSEFETIYGDGHLTCYSNGRHRPPQA